MTDADIREDAMTERVIHIHEDYWGMRNLYPVEAFAHVSRDVRSAAEAGEKNRAPSGMGWTDVYLIEPPANSYVDVELSLTVASQALSSIMPRIRKFNATATAGLDPNVRDPWGSYENDAYC